MLNDNELLILISVMKVMELISEKYKKYLDKYISIQQNGDQIYTNE